MNLIEYALYAERICFGERVKGGVYKPSSTTIPYTTISGALSDALGIAARAVGTIDSISTVSHLTIAPRDRSLHTARLPLKVMYLEGVAGKIRILNENFISEQLDDSFQLFMGAMRMKGLGKCLLSKKTEIEITESDYVEGSLITRIPVSVANTFVMTVKDARYGYLFVRENDETGKYVLSYYEGSLVRAPYFLVEGGKKRG